MKNHTFVAGQSQEFWKNVENAEIQFVLFREYFWKYVPVFDIQ